jgi:multiple sugar transport system permease protein
VPHDGTQEPVFTVFIYCCALLLAARHPRAVLWLFIMSISPAADLSAKPLALVAAVHRLLPLRVCFRRRKQRRCCLRRLARNSIEVAGMATFAAIALAIPAGWAVSRTPSVGWSLTMVIATYMLPPVALAVPLYMGLRISACSTTSSGWRWSI